jgi:hypothetical protein
VLIRQARRFTLSALTLCCGDRWAGWDAVLVVHRLKSRWFLVVVTELSLSVVWSDRAAAAERGALSPLTVRAAVGR